MRFAVQIVKRSRDLVPEGFPIVYRISLLDLVEDGESVVIERHGRTAARRALSGVREVRSIAQLGNRLRVLLPRDVGEPVALLRAAIAATSRSVTSSA